MNRQNMDRHDQDKKQFEHVSKLDDACSKAVRAWCQWQSYIKHGAPQSSIYNARYDYMLAKAELNRVVTAYALIEGRG